MNLPWNRNREEVEKVARRLDESSSTLTNEVNKLQEEAQRLRDLALDLRTLVETDDPEDGTG